MKLKIIQLVGIMLAGFSIAICFINISQNDRNEERKLKMKSEVNQLGVDFGVVNQNIQRAEDLVIQVTFTNKSNDQIRLNSLFLEIPKVLLEVRKAGGTPIYPGSPPRPPNDDGKTGRINLSPGDSTTFTYKGSDYFGTSLAEGKYQVRFRYENKITKYGDWTGTIETDWVNFEVRHSKPIS